jgi:hypothetical protein
VAVVYFFYNTPNEIRASEPAGSNLSASADPGPVARLGTFRPLGNQGAFPLANEKTWALAKDYAGK